MGVGPERNSSELEPNDDLAALNNWVGDVLRTGDVDKSYKITAKTLAQITALADGDQNIQNAGGMVEAIKQLQDDISAERVRSLKDLNELIAAHSPYRIVLVKDGVKSEVLLEGFIATEDGALQPISNGEVLDPTMCAVVKEDPDAAE